MPRPTNRLICRLNGYYIFVHPYFPILPAPESSINVDNPTTIEPARYASTPTDFEPSSPISLAISAILVLIPHPNDRNPKDSESVLRRREQAHTFALSTMESIEIESELIDSSTSPAQALCSNPTTFHREPFHEKVPIELESILALLVLSIYEYAQRGNVLKMRNRAGQALVAAMNLNLHARGEEDDIFAEARRRAWWMTVRDSFIHGRLQSCNTNIISIRVCVKGQSSAVR